MALRLRIWQSHRHRPRLAMAAVVLVVVAWTLAPTAATSRPAPAQSVAPGTVLMRLRVPGPGVPIEALVLRVDLVDPHVRAGLLYPGALAGVRTLSAMAGAAGAFAGVNGDFFNIGASGAPVGPVVTGGQLIKAPQPGRGLAAGVGLDGLGRVSAVALNGYVTLPGGGGRGGSAGGGGASPVGGRAPLADLNDANPGYPPMLAPNGIGLFTPAWGSYPRAGAVRGLGEVVEVLIRAGRVAAVSHYAGAGPIAAGTYVLLGAGAGARALGRLRIGQPVIVHVAQHTAAASPFAFALGGKYRLLRGGEVEGGLPPFPGAARTAVGFSNGGRTMFLVATEPTRVGVSDLDLARLARFMRGLGVQDAVNLDDGGSTTMVARLPGRPGLTLLNRPADGVERRVANGIGLFAVPAPSQ